MDCGLAMIIKQRAKVRESEREKREIVCVRERECVCERERECVYVRERERRERECVRERREKENNKIKEYSITVHITANST